MLTCTFQVFHLLKSRLPNFGAENWTSELRTHAGHQPFMTISVADFQYEDAEGVLTELLYGESQREAWKGMWPVYYLEVKTTSDSAYVPFHVSPTQLATVRDPCVEDM